ncbi:MAG: hypothetical protein ACTSVW_06755 [Candidatus Njordarchaeales archaeon]
MKHIKNVILIIILLISIGLFLYYNFPYQQKETPSAFGTYLDTQSFYNGYEFSRCIIEPIDFSTDVNSLFYFSCNIKQEELELPIGFLVTFPFKIEKSGGVCRRPIHINATTREGIPGEEECIDITSSIDNDYILRGQFEEYNETKFFYQFQLYGKDIFYWVSPERLRFKMALTTNELPIVIGYCHKMGLPEDCAKLKLPHELRLKIKIPRDKYEIDFSSAYPQFSIRDNGKDGYEISWNLKDANFIQFDLVDKEKEKYKTIINFISPALFGIVLAMFFQQWYNWKKKK